MPFSGPWNGDAPLIVRIAGLPAPVMVAFSSQACSAALRDAAQLRYELHRCRAEMVDRLHAAIPGSPPSLRQLLLTVKRDCFNGREIGRIGSRPTGRPWSGSSVLRPTASWSLNGGWLAGKKNLRRSINRSTIANSASWSI